MPESKEFQSLAEFYPHYLNEHRNGICRILHFVGTSLVISSLLFFLYTVNIRFLIAVPFLGYGFAWVGHFFFERNKPATFRYPTYSLASDFILFWELLIGRELFYPK